MTNRDGKASTAEEQMREILDELLADDRDISARAVARLHPSIKAASSFTRSTSRSQMLAEYQQRQLEYRRWRGRVAKRSGTDTAASLADKDIRIAELEATVQLLTASHLAMLRVVGEFGGFSKWAKFYEQYRDARNKLGDLGALPPIRSTRDIAKEGINPVSAVLPITGMFASPVSAIYEISLTPPLLYLLAILAGKSLFTHALQLLECFRVSLAHSVEPALRESL